ncbi:MAG: hypothetical protein R6V03_05080 [Kiritimatiellia bacterium]
MKRLMPIALLSTAAVILTTGCASVPYRYGKNIETPNMYRLPPGEPQFERGRPHAFLDASDWIWPGSLLGKLLLWDIRVDCHEVSPHTEAALREYLEKNDIKSVKVRINQYTPRGEWHRTMRNTGMRCGWRYTLGFMSWLGYTIYPGRFFGGDNYNPYSNTINIYSDIPEVALHEGGHAKDFADCTWKGGYAALYAYVPFANLYHEAKATGDAIGYLIAEGKAQSRDEAYRILYPAYGTYVGGDIAEWLPPPYSQIGSAAGAVVGHIVGRIKAANAPPFE